MYKYIKSFLDRSLALIGTIVILPFLLLFSLMIAIDSKGPIYFKQKRSGLYGKTFYVYKFRTMKTTNVKFDINKPVIGDDNQNVTRVGKIFRKLKIDELPQLYNVIRGEMSLIGPRPLMPVYIDQYERWEMQKFKIKPGITGLSQVRGNGYLKPIERSYYDVVYANKYSFAVDISILWDTLKVILFGEKRYTKRVGSEEIEKMRDIYGK